MPLEGEWEIGVRMGNRCQRAIVSLTHIFAIFNSP